MSNYRVEPFSMLEASMKAFEADSEFRRMAEKIQPFPDSEMTPEKREARKARAMDNYWYFDATYFPDEAYSEGKSKPGAFHKKLIQIFNTSGINVVLGPRKHAKTAFAKKEFVWSLLTGRLSFGATGSATLPTARNILRDIDIFLNSPRIKADFGIVFEEENNEQLTFTVPGQAGIKRVIAISEGRSARGATVGFDRPRKILIDDLETLQSPLGSEQTNDRIRIIKEAYQSMSDNGILIVLGNNFDENCALNQIKKEYENNLLPEHWHVHTFKAWNGRPLWAARYPAKSEAALRSMLRVTDEAEWQGEFQQNPVPPDGLIFSREHFNKIPRSALPKDARGAVYTDPNLAKKGKGDTTGATSLLYSPSTNKFYIDGLICRSFNDPNKLLEAVAGILHSRHKVLGFDGNVSQESHWSAHVRNWCAVNRSPFPYIEYCRYNVDNIAKTLQSIWNEDRIVFIDDVIETKEGEAYLRQLFSFAGKRQKKKDDAPDSLLGAYLLMFERHMVKSKSSVLRNPIFISDGYL